MDLTTIFYYLDEFIKEFEKALNRSLLTKGTNRRVRTMSLSLSEVVTILVYYHRSGFKTFKDYYIRSSEIQSAFPKLPSYTRFIELQQKTFLPLCVISKMRTNYESDGISFIDSFSLKVCHPKRISSNKVFKGLATRGKTSMGWFFGFKLHTIINTKGEIIQFSLTRGNIADNNEHLLLKLMKSITGKVYGDKGYIVNHDLFKKLYSQGAHIITKIRKTMKNKLMNCADKFMLSKRGIIESVGNILKNTCNIEHSRYRSPITLVLNVCSGLIAYSFHPNKPSLKSPQLRLA